jgi:hypothetical protein
MYAITGRVGGEPARTLLAAGEPVRTSARPASPAQSNRAHAHQRSVPRGLSPKQPIGIPCTLVRGIMECGDRVLATSRCCRPSAVTPGGQSRVVERLPGWAVLQDATPQGQVLVTRERIRVRMFVHTDDPHGDREVSWLDGTNLNGVSADRKLLLLTEAAAGGRPGFSTYLRPIDNSPAVRLEEGWVSHSLLMAGWRLFSPQYERNCSQFQLERAAPGRPTGGVTGFAQDTGAWLPDGKLIFQGRDAQGVWRLFVQKLEGAPQNRQQ